MGEDKREAQQNDGKEQVPEEEEDHEYDEGEGLLPADFTPATTAHDLPRMGHLSQWNDFPPSQADIYQGYVLDFL